MAPDFTSIAVIRLDNIGDTLLTLPFIEALRSRYRDATITVFCQPKSAGLFLHNPHVNQVVPIPEIHPSLRDAPEVRAHMAEFARLYRGAFDLVVNPRPAPDHYRAGDYAAATEAPRRIGFRQTESVAGYDPNPAYTDLLDLPGPGENPAYAPGRVLARLGVAAYEPKPRLIPGLRARDKARDSLTHGQWIALGIGASNAFRRWPEENFSELLRHLTQEGYRAVLVGGADDSAAAQAILRDEFLGTIDLTGKTDLDELAAILSLCRLFIGNDSGPKHIAAAVGTPVVEIGCYSPDARDFLYERDFAPIGVPAVRVMPQGRFSSEETLAGLPVRSVTVPAVLDAAHALLPMSAKAAEEGPIIVDGIFFQSSNTGIARLWEELLRRWSARPFGKRILLLDRGGLPADLANRMTTLPYPPTDRRRSDWEGERPALQALCDRHKAPLFLSSYYTRPSDTPSLQLIYDMIPERLEADLADAMWVEKHEAIRHARAFVCISQSTLNDLRLYFPETAEKPAAVAHLGVSPAFHPPGDELLRQFHEIFTHPNLQGRRYILFGGEPVGYKNGELLVEALSRIDCSDLAVLFTRVNGRAEENEVIAALRCIPGLVIFQQTLTDVGLQLAYASAHCMVFPSFYEGFGMPIVEAMACGCPVICSGTSSMPEVAGDAAILIDPTRADSLVNALRQMDDPEIRQTLIERGFRRARHFSWDRFADEVESFVLRQLAAMKAPPPCRLCGHPTHYWGDKTVLGRHEVAYGLCENCQSLQTEPPYWLDEAYSGDAAGLDASACQRAFDLVQETTVLLDLLGFPKDAKCADFGAGDGLYARMMRDRGHDFVAQDKYARPRFMEGFTIEAISANQFHLITGFDVIESLPNPATDIANLLGAGAALVIISAHPYEGQDQDWAELRLESGQRTFFYSLKALASLAAAYGYRVSQGRQTFAFFSEAYVSQLAARGMTIDSAITALRDGAVFFPRAMGLLAEHLQEPYRYAARDEQARSVHGHLTLGLLE